MCLCRMTGLQDNANELAELEKLCAQEFTNSVKQLCMTKASATQITEGIDDFAVAEGWRLFKKMGCIYSDGVVRPNTHCKGDTRAWEDALVSKVKALPIENLSREAANARSLFEDLKTKGLKDLYCAMLTSPVNSFFGLKAVLRDVMANVVQNITLDIPWEHLDYTFSDETMLMRATAKSLCLDVPIPYSIEDCEWPQGAFLAAAHSDWFNKYIEIGQQIWLTTLDELQNDPPDTWMVQRPSLRSIRAIDARKDVRYAIIEGFFGIQRGDKFYVAIYLNTACNGLGAVMIRRNIENRLYGRYGHNTRSPWFTAVDDYKRPRPTLSPATGAGAGAGAVTGDDNDEPIFQGEVSAMEAVKKRFKTAELAGEVVDLDSQGPEKGATTSDATVLD